MRFQKEYLSWKYTAGYCQYHGRVSSRILCPTRRGSAGYINYKNVLVYYGFFSVSLRFPRLDGERRKPVYDVTLEIIIRVPVPEALEDLFCLLLMSRFPPSVCGLNLIRFSITFSRTGLTVINSGSGRGMRGICVESGMKLDYKKKSFMKTGGWWSARGRGYLDE